MTPVQSVIAAVELGILVIGVIYLVHNLSDAQRRSAWFAIGRIAPSGLAGFEALLLLLFIMLCGFTGQFVAIQIFSETIKAASDRTALEVMVYGAALHGGALLGWPLFKKARNWSYADYGTVPTASIPTPRLPLKDLVVASVIALVAALPVVTVVSLLWTLVLRQLGLPDQPQDLVEIFAKIDSPYVILGLIVVACVLAPLNEELVFRGLIFRSIYQRRGRAAAYLLSSLAFGILHGNWAGFLPLAFFGAALAFAYEKTGDIRVPILAHACFNLNTIAIIIAGLPTL